MVERIEINLLPAEYRVHKKTIRIAREVFWPVFLVFAAAAALWIWTMFLDGQIRFLQEQSVDLDRKIEQNKHIEQEIAELRTERKTIVQKIQALERISVNRARWVRLMEVFSQKLPDYTWLTSVSEKDSVVSAPKNPTTAKPAMPPKTGVATTDSSAIKANTIPVLTVEGRTFAFPEVASYMSKLKESPYIANVDLSNIEQLDNNSRVYKFSISCATNTNIGITEDADSLGVSAPGTVNAAKTGAKP